MYAERNASPDSRRRRDSSLSLPLLSNSPYATMPRALLSSLLSDHAVYGLWTMAHAALRADALPITVPESTRRKTGMAGWGPRSRVLAEVLRMTIVKKRPGLTPS